MGTRPRQQRPAAPRRPASRVSALGCGCLLLACVSSGSTAEPVGYFFRNVSNREPTTLSAPLPPSLSWLSGVSHYRLVPGTFPQGMDYHFDGLATLVRFRFGEGGEVDYSVRAFESEAYRDYHHCDFFASGTGPTSVSSRPCLTNPVVNLAPLDGQLWLTIDTRFWGRMEPHSMDTLPDRVDVPGTVLNAHPACEPAPSDEEEEEGGKSKCYVAYGCGYNPSSTHACISTLATSQGRAGHRLGVTNVSTSPALPHSKLLLHSHSPALTQSQLIVKLESFTPRIPHPLTPHQKQHHEEEEALSSSPWFDGGDGAARGGVLSWLHQAEDDLFLVMNRSTNTSRLLRSSGFSFVNNHFWNAYDDHELGGSVLDTIPATGRYLDTYFRSNLQDSSSPGWHRILLPPRRCLVPFEGGEEEDSSSIQCKELVGSSPGLLLDYPTFNPLMKTRKYRTFYAIAPHSYKARWFDSVVKVDAESGRVVSVWRGGEGVFVTEADFVPRQGLDEAATGEEDDGVLLTVTYDSSTDSSSLVVLDAKDGLRLLGALPLPGEPLSFHAHGIVCTRKRCFSNP